MVIIPLQIGGKVFHGFHCIRIRKFDKGVSQQNGFKKEVWKLTMLNWLGSMREYRKSCGVGTHQGCISNYVPSNNPLGHLAAALG